MDRIHRDHNEKRNFIRMKIDTPAEVVIYSQGHRVKGICRDLSGGGMLIETAAAAAAMGLNVGAKLDVKLASRYGDSPMLKARTQLARVQPSRSGGSILGLEILEMLD
ncbi:MAG: PilZ domain-containing protein [Cellvibrionaceae bacterium]